MTALQSVKIQGFDKNLSVIVCDNSPEASSRDQVAAFAAKADFPVVFVHEPKTGVANARNSAVAACHADFIAFLDDDEEAPADWLYHLMATQRQFAADVVFGPVKARLNETSIDKDARLGGYFTRFFSRFGPESSQILDVYYGCGNSLIRRSALPTDELPFSIAQNNMGGEDDQLFHGLQTKGAIIAWAADAPVFEDVPPSRARLSYTLARAFAYGQGPGYTAALDGKPVSVIYWMAQGMIQMVLFALWGGILQIIGHRDSAKRLDTAARGLGKIFWMPPFKIGFYGTALLKPKPRGR